MSTIQNASRPQALRGVTSRPGNSSIPIAGFVQARAAQILGDSRSGASSLDDLRGGNAGAASSAARQTYLRHGSVSHDLGNRQDVGRLISRSPQLDNISSTRGDTTRCGGAAMFNAMLLDGDFRANSSALRQLAQSRNVQLSSSQQSALDAMQSGRLNPNQSAQLQELLYRVADTQDRRVTGAGLTGVELSATVGALTQYGGFPNTREVNFRMSPMGGGAQHWTTTSTTSQGTAHADSWPQANGYATVGAGPGSTGFTRAGQFDPTFTADVTLTRGLDGTFLRTRATSGPGGAAVEEGQAPTAVQERNFRLSPRAQALGQRNLDPNSGLPL